MPSLGTLVVLICLVAGYFVIVESRNFVLKDYYNKNSDTIRKKTLRSYTSYAEIAKWVKKYITNEKLKRNKEKQNESKALIGKIIKKEIRKLYAKRNLRNGMEVHNLLHKLNNFINQNTQHNNYQEKRFDCHFGFGNPSRDCKRQKFRRHSTRKSKKAHDTKEKYTYAQPMYVERAYFGSSSSSDEELVVKPKSRFQVVDNKHKYHNNNFKESSESEGQSLEVYSKESGDNRHAKANKTPYHDKSSNKYKNKPFKTKHVSYSDEDASYEDNNKPIRTKHVSYSDEDASNEDNNKPIRTKHVSYSDEDASNEDNNRPIKTKYITSSSDEDVEKPKKTVKSESEESAKASDEPSMEENDDKYLYLQGTRLQKPGSRSGRFKSGRRGDRLPYFMPKRYKWKSDMIHNLGTYWENIKAYDPHHDRYYSW